MQSRSITKSRFRTISSMSNLGVFSVNSSPATSEAEIFVVANAGNNNGNFVTPNPISFTRTVYVMFDGSEISIYPAGNQYTRYDRAVGPDGTSVSGTVGLSRSYSNNVYNEALGRVFEQVRGSFDGAISIAEMGSTVKMVKSALKLVKYVRSFHPKEWGNKWLEYQYGWKPLVSDIYSFAEASQKQLPQHFRVKARASEQETARQVATWRTYGTEIRTGSISRRCEIVCNFQISPSILQSLGNFSSLNPASIAWELTPYSFVIDWMVDIGGYLRNLETACLYSQAFKSGYVTQGYKLTVEGSRALSYTYPSGISTSASYRSTVNYTSKTRAVLGSIPYPKKPKFQVDLGSTRLISAAALLSQHLSFLKR